MTITTTEVAAVMVCALDLMENDGYRTTSETEVLRRELGHLGVDSRLLNEIVEIAKDFKPNGTYVESFGEWFDSPVAAARRPGKVKDEALDIIRAMSVQKKGYMSGLLVAIAKADGEIDDGEWEWWNKWCCRCGLPEHTMQQALDFWREH